MLETHQISLGYSTYLAQKLINEGGLQNQMQQWQQCYQQFAACCRNKIKQYSLKVSKSALQAFVIITSINKWYMCMSVVLESL